MNQILAKLYEGADLSGSIPDVLYMPIIDSRTLTVIKVKSDANVSGADAVFQLKKNGGVITGAEAITISVGNKIGTVSSLAVALVEGDEITLDLLSGAVSTPVTLFITTTRTVGTDEITEVTNKKYVTDAEKTKLANTSGTNTGDESASSIGAIVNGASAATPNNSDLVATVESSVLKKITWTNVKAFLKTYFDTIYQAALVSGTNIKTVNSTSILGSGDIPVSDASIATTDITTNNVSTSKHGFAPKLPNDATKYLDGTGAFSVPAGGGGGSSWTTIKKTTSENRSSTTTLANDTNLQFSMTANKAYAIRMFIPVFCASATPQIKYALNGPASPSSVYVSSKHVISTGTATSNVGFGYTGSTILPTSGLGWIEFNLVVRNGSNSGTFAFQWAQNTSDSNVSQVSNGAVLEYTEI